MAIKRKSGKDDKVPPDRALTTASVSGVDLPFRTDHDRHGDHFLLVRLLINLSLLSQFIHHEHKQDLRLRWRLDVLPRVTELVHQMRPHDSGVRAIAAPTPRAGARGAAGRAGSEAERFGPHDDARHTSTNVNDPRPARMQS